jgi:glucose-1-phosphate thymidylyltransferase
MKAIIPIAGKGTRMRPHTLHYAKVLLPVAGKPMIDYIVEELIDNKINDIVFIIGYLGDQIINHIQKQFPGINAEFVEQKEMLGLGHAIYMANDYVQEEELFIILGDTLFDVHFKEMVSTSYSNLGVKTVEDPSRFGVAVTENDFITQLVEKPKTPISNLALVGLYYVKNGRLLMKSIEKIMTDNIKTSGEFQLTDALQVMLDEGEKFIPFPVENWYDCGKPETILSTNQTILQKGRDNSGDFSNHPNSKVLSPAYIGKGVTLENCVIGPNVSVSDNCSLTNCIISGTIILNNTIIQNYSLKHSIIGANVEMKKEAQQQSIGDNTQI